MSRPVSASADARLEANSDAYDVEAIRRDFPILQTRMHGKRLAFLDSAASAQKPRAVMLAIEDLYEHAYANIHGGVNQLAAVSTRR